MNTKNSIIKLLGLLFLFSISLELKAEEVKPASSKKVAINAFSYYSGKAPDELRIVQEIPVKHLDTALLYFYNFDNGFVIIAADNVAEPVLGFGVDTPVDFDDMPPGLLFLLECYQQEILHAKRLKAKALPEVSAKWDEYLTPNPSKARYIPATYLIATTWNQSGGYVSGSSVGYNYYCPVIPGDGRKGYVGCGAVALAQILKYWSCNVHPQGSVTHTQSGFSSTTINLANQTYSWNSMRINQADIYNALLLYHCAIALNSQFKSDGTSSNPDIIYDRLRNNFGFSAAKHFLRDLYSGDWINLLKTNIDNRRPVFYAGFKNTNQEGGHGWIVDGYSSNNYFHCNWGWGGSHDGWYLLSNITPNGQNYNFAQRATVDIYPTYYTGIMFQNTTISTNTYTGHTITVENCTIQNNANVILKANCTTEIFGPFSIPLGATLEVRPY